MSDDNQPSSEDQAADAAPVGGDGKPVSPTVSREEFRGVVGDRDKYKTEAKDLAKKLADLEAAKLDPAKPKAPDDPGMPEWAKQFTQNVTTRLDGLDQKVDGNQSASTKDAATNAILEQVPEGNRATVKVMLPGLGVDLTSPTAVADAMSALTQHHQSVMVDHSRGQPRRAPQKGPDGKLSFEGFDDIDDIPPEHRQAAFSDPATLQRLVAGASGASTRGRDGHNI